MSRIEKGDAYSLGDLLRPVIGDGEYLRKHAAHIFLPIKWDDGLGVDMVPLDGPIQVTGVRRLNHRRVLQHQHAEVPRRGGRENGTPKAILAEERKGSRVVDVGMRQDHRVDGRGIEAEVLISFTRLGPSTLVKPAVATPSPGWSERGGASP